MSNKKAITVNELCFKDPLNGRESFRGVGSLNDSELLGFILRGRDEDEDTCLLAEKVLGLAGGGNGLSMLYHVSFTELMEMEELGRDRALKLICIGELARRINLSVRKAMPCFSCADDIARYYMEEMRHLETERLKLVMLDSRRQLVREKTVFSGTVSRSIFEPREILIEALRADSVYMVILHNHPSGDPTPGQSDISSTARLKEAGDLIGIRLLDHIIIGDNRYCSLSQAGLL